MCTTLALHIAPHYVTMSNIVPFTHAAPQQPQPQSGLVYDPPEEKMAFTVTPDGLQYHPAPKMLSPFREEDWPELDKLIAQQPPRD